MTMRTSLRQLKECLPRHEYKRVAPSVGGEERYGMETPLPLTLAVTALGPHAGLTLLRFATHPTKAEVIARLFAVSCIRHVANEDDRKSVLLLLSTAQPREAIEFERRNLVNSGARKGLVQRLGILMAISTLLDENQNLFARAQQVADIAVNCSLDQAHVEIEWQRQSLVGLLLMDPAEIDKKGALDVAMSANN